MFRPSWVNILGIKYKIGTVIHTGFKEALPIFGLVKAIYIVNSSIKRIYFCTETLHTEGFCEDYHTYIERKIIHPQCKAIGQRSLQYYLPLHFAKPFGTTDQLHILPKHDIHNSY